MRRCSKIRYRTRVDAQIALASARRKAVLGRGPTADKRREERTYRCPRCRGWHLTSATLEEVNG